ncbi:hypothetical protein O1R50_18565 [Glycomyces luteolus]|uniref:Uncharacterized protein n=1 Tax=Glycomyces luteolus TaxID=2670330 RepID=A0A9X3PA60_9ACTN|nr:hypothetical protein [Glycomyces luteolus]MDA1361638.1 hypothetical protein [Glycomyces luteolus]
MVINNPGNPLPVFHRDEEPPEEPGVNCPMVRLREHLEEPPRILQQLQHQAHRPPGGLQPSAPDPLKPLADPSELIPQVPNLLVQPSLRPVRVTDELQKLILLTLQPLTLARQLRPQLFIDALAIDYRLLQLHPKLSRQGRRYPKPAVVRPHFCFHYRDRYSLAATGLVCPAAADEVRVFDPAAVRHRVEVEPRPATCAPDHALQWVVVHPLPKSAVVLPQDFLHPVEQILTHQRLVSPLMLDTLEGDPSEVVAIPQDRADGVHRDLPSGRAPLARPSPKPGVSHSPLQLLERVHPARIQLEHHPDEGSPLLVNDHGPNLAALDGLASVPVSDGRLVRRSSIGGLRTHLVSHVCTRRPRLILVDPIEDRGHEIADVGVLGVVHDRNELNPKLLELPPRDRRIRSVPVHPRPRVHDDRPDVLLVPDARHHLQELRPPIDRHTGLPRLDVLGHDLHPKLLGLALARVPLRWNRVPLRGVIRLHLPPRGHPQIEHGTFRPDVLTHDRSAFRLVDSVRPAAFAEPGSTAALRSNSSAASIKLSTISRTSTSSRSAPVTRTRTSLPPTRLTAPPRQNSRSTPR